MALSTDRLNPTSSMIVLASGSVPLANRLSKTANFSGDDVPVVGGYRSLVITLHIHSASRATANETYDFYVTTRLGDHIWDIAHFAQVAATGEALYVARVNTGGTLPQTVTSAGLASNDTLLTVTSGGTHAVKSLAAGSVRHGPVGDKISHELVTGGTAPSVVYSIRVHAE